METWQNAELIHLPDNGLDVYKLVRDSFDSKVYQQNHRANLSPSNAFVPPRRSKWENVSTFALPVD